MSLHSNDSSIEGDVFIQQLASHIRKNEEGLANGLLYFSKAKSQSNVKSSRLSFTIHHLYFITDRIESSPLGVDVGPLNIKLDTPNHEPTFISFMANNARSSKHFDSDARSISSINSVRSIMSSASVYWRNLGYLKDPKAINKDLNYLYSSFTKIPCLVLNPRTKIHSILGYEEYPCDTSVPLKMFKNLQVLEVIDYEPNEIFGWHCLCEQLRILIIKSNKVNSIEEVLFNLVVDDEYGRTSFNSTTSHSSLKAAASGRHNLPSTDLFDDHQNASSTTSLLSLPSFHSHSHSHSQLDYVPPSFNDHYKNLNFRRQRANTSSSSEGNQRNSFYHNSQATINSSMSASRNNNNNSNESNSALTHSTDLIGGGAGSSSLPKDYNSSLKYLTEDNCHSHYSHTYPEDSVGRDYTKLPEGKWLTLKQLTIQDTSIKSIAPFVFKPFCNLVKLNLSNNLLEEIPPGLNQLTNVRFINLNDNYITSLKNLPTSLKQLTTLSLNSNHITNLDGLEKLKTLQKLDLRRNKLKGIESLKPIVLLFVKIPSILSNVYVSLNPDLGKHYRIDLFNLFNGVKYKNSVKIDDSRPGYFEGALLLDQEASFLNLTKYLSINVSNGTSTTKSKATPPPFEIEKLCNRLEDISAVLKETPKTQPLTIITSDDGMTTKLNYFKIRQPKSKPGEEEVEEIENEGSKHDLPKESLVFSSHNQTLDPNSTFIVEQERSTSSSATLLTSTSKIMPLSVNLNLSNTNGDFDGMLSKSSVTMSTATVSVLPQSQTMDNIHQKLSISNGTIASTMSTSNASMQANASTATTTPQLLTPKSSKPSLIRRSTTFTQVDLESPTTAATTSTAPIILTPVQVTARMST
ncbi:uncharacterized protein KQ657_000468 [Scheffersomyces spartinae]|uniref:Leucine-rich repeat-containing protein n=1 Tax=Scheffersomyces spartinae TaxID=45513 RepID=A0A9P7V9I5_9ASCO|nr:uncharacterized protein KQ657_000468 [Scheffersomyces spartinae]KAG7193776.1 hypothetical protein KQ657_000468 [Scheffersomyces spartinae]